MLPRVFCATGGQKQPRKHGDHQPPWLSERHAHTVDRSDIRKMAGSCITRVRWEAPCTHPLNEPGCDALAIEHGCVRRDIEMQVLLMHPTEGTQVGPQLGTSPFTGVTVHLTPAIAVIIPRPFVHAVTDGAMVRMAAPIALPLVGVELGAAG